MNSDTNTQLMAENPSTAPHGSLRAIQGADYRWFCSGCGSKFIHNGDQHCTVPGCHHTFTSTVAGDTHRVGPHDGDRRCLTTMQMLELEREDGSPIYERVMHGEVVVWRIAPDEQ